MHLVIFCDGTWNTPDQMDGPLSAPTNVVKLKNALAEHDEKGAEQRVYYHPGVGTDGGLWNRVAGGGMGEGLDKNIKSAYHWLALNYEPGAKIWLFGFSRGAYSARSLGGMISRCGLLNPPAANMTETQTWSAVDDLFAVYRTPDATAKPVKATQKRPFHLRQTGDLCKHSIPIHFIGVWDTVGSLGIPDDMALLNLIDDPTAHSFHDTNLSPVVANARHAVAIDEKRQSFIPTLWENTDNRPTVQQVWFPGAHGDVGGGYGRVGLSDGALGWMIEEAGHLGLGFRNNVIEQLSPDPLAQVHDSVTGIFKSLKTRPRDVPLFSATNPLLHESAKKRYATPPLSQGPYWKTKRLGDNESTTVDVFARDRWNFTSIYLEAGVKYQLSATGEWVDGSIKCGPEGTRDGKFHIGEIAQLASSLFGKTETLYKKLTGNEEVDFWYTKREEKVDWFALIGVVANGVLPPLTPEKKMEYLPHEVFVIGKSKSFTPKQSGYLYAFANDAWQMYENNRGSVKLKVQR
jgi:hypothetical protein